MSKKDEFFLTKGELKLRSLMEALAAARKTTEKIDDLQDKIMAFSRKTQSRLDTSELEETRRKIIKS